MKRTMMVSLLLTVAIATQAQLGRKIAPQMQKGMQKTYVQKTVTETPGQSAFTITTEDKYTVAEATADGYVIDVVTTSLTSDAAPENIAGQMVNMQQEIMKGVIVRLAVNKDGKPVKVLNMDDVKQQVMKQASSAVDGLFKANPAIAQALPKEMLLQQFEQSLTEEHLLTSTTENGPLALNGKTVMTGAQEEFTNGQGLKMKRMYFVNGDNITTSSTLNMTKDEMKALIITQLEQSLPAEQVDMVKQNIDQMMDSGMLKIDSKDTTTYEFSADGWVKAAKTEQTVENAGQQTKITSEVTCK